ncbi:hypothetical protein [Salinimicrobium sp. TH3]|uniref:hypothetical protein n=1 Tax=Salinimicrobium sp. TH3 TaxID=2997342 RepID=UPI0022763B1C|nr:hypothetical protein [Salinimicrobium sp. TH3]MCY2687786.1 hypothetical protein [Salinimicrobium sp. TH3]
MKTKITRYSRRVVIFTGMLFMSVLLWNCDTQDLEFIDPYEFVNDDFDGIPDLSEVIDEDPEIVEPEVGTVEKSAETQALISDILNAGATGEISQESKEKLQSVETYTQQLSAAVNEQAQNLTTADIANILDPAQELNADLEQLRESLKSAPASVRALLPKIQLTVDFEDLPGTAAQANAQAQPSYTPFDAFMQTVSGPCADAAYAAYDAKILLLTEQRDANFFIIESNYARRLDEADDRLVERQNAQADRLETIRTEMIDATGDILAAAEEAESLGETETAAQLRQLALLYAVDARTALAEWNGLVLELLEVRMTQEKAQALAIREAKTAEVTTEFLAAKTQADAILQQSLEDCHNQGSGN